MAAGTPIPATIRAYALVMRRAPSLESVKPVEGKPDRVAHGRGTAGSWARRARLRTRIGDRQKSSAGTSLLERGELRSGLDLRRARRLEHLRQAFWLGTRLAIATRQLRSLAKVSFFKVGKRRLYGTLTTLNGATNP
jgi:hypothetical protein